MAERGGGQGKEGEGEGGLLLLREQVTMEEVLAARAALEELPPTETHRTTVTATTAITITTGGASCSPR